METKRSDQSWSDYMNSYLKKNGKAMINLSTLESLRRIWFIMGVRVGYKTGKSGKELADSYIKELYRQIRRYERGGNNEQQPEPKRW